MSLSQPLCLYLPVSPSLSLGWRSVEPWGGDLSQGISSVRSRQSRYEYRREFLLREDDSVSLIWRSKEFKPPEVNCTRLAVAGDFSVSGTLFS